MITRHRHKLIIIAAFLASKLLHLALLLLTPTQFDISAPGTTLLERTVRWDAVYFSSLFTNGPLFEHEWVFGPLWIKIVNTAAQVVTPHISPLSAGLILSNLSQLLASFVLYEYTMVMFMGSSEVALKSTVLFIWSSTGVFGTVAYSENFAALMSIVGLYLREVSFINNKHFIYFLSSIFFSLAYLTRSNCIVLGLSYIYDLFVLRDKRAIVAGGFLGLSIFVSLYIPFKEFCPGRPWCDSILPSLYSYAQAYYWNVGLLKYWTLNNLFNFAIAVPVIVLQIQSINSFFLTRCQPLVLSNIAFVLVIVLFAHVQIIVRTSSFLPLQFWYLAQQLSRKKGHIWVMYLIGWIPLQTVLYGGFLPPA